MKQSFEVAPGELPLLSVSLSFYKITTPAIISVPSEIPQLRSQDVDGIRANISVQIWLSAPEGVFW